MNLHNHSLPHPRCGTSLGLRVPTLTFPVNPAPLALKRNRSQAHYLLVVRGAESTMSPEDAIDRILELSAEAQTKRREAAENSSAFHKLTGAVSAYGQALDLLTKLRKEPYRKQGIPAAPVTALGYPSLPSSS